MGSSVPPLVRAQVPPILGDGKGIYRIHIIGNSGSGKSTTSRQLAALLNIPHIPLDEFFWNPDWSQASSSEFQSRISILVSQHRNTGWIIDGNYTRKIGDVISSERTDCIWLDPPLLLYFPRLLFRTFLRLIRQAPPCAPGCQETLVNVLKLNEQSILWWCITNHGPCQEFGRKLMLEEGDVKDGGRVRRLGGWGQELRDWMEEVEVLAEKQKL